MSRAASAARTRPALPLTREKIAAAALRLAKSREGVMPPMRQVAGELGVDVAALYRHFENKRALEIHVARLASDNVELPRWHEGPWTARFLEITGAIRDRIRQHPELGFHGGGSPNTNPFNARANAALAEVLFDAGLRGRELLFATQALLHQITAVAQSEVLALGSSRDENRRFAEQISEQLSEEVRASWPRRAPRASGLFDFDVFFDYSMRIHLASIEARVDESDPE